MAVEPIIIIIIITMNNLFLVVHHAVQRKPDILDEHVGTIFKIKE
jgi:hypothetical protein